MSHRKTMRDLARASLQAAPHFADFVMRRSWAMPGDAKDLPALGVATPREPAESDTKDVTRRNTQLVVTARRAGGDDLEDLLDEDAEAIEIAVLSGVSFPGLIVSELSQTEVSIDGTGAKRIGTVQVTFLFVVYTQTIFPED